MNENIMIYMKLFHDKGECKLLRVCRRVNFTQAGDTAGQDVCFKQINFKILQFLRAIFFSKNNYKRE